MPAKTTPVNDSVLKRLAGLGQQIRTHRKALRTSATATAEAAGVSRVTLHRIETGEGAVTLGAYLNVLDALGLEVRIGPSNAPSAEPSLPDRRGWIPARIELAEYPELRRLAWQVHGTDALTPSEAHSIYERNARHLEPESVSPAERDLIDALRTVFSGNPRDV